MMFNYVFMFLHPECDEQLINTSRIYRLNIFIIKNYNVYKIEIVFSTENAYE